jgi:hypothetical protein
MSLRRLVSLRGLMSLRSVLHPARLRPRTLLPRTLRGRLIAGLLALLAAGCATVGLVTYFAVQGTLSRELSDQLETATSLAWNCWQGDGSANTGGGGANGDYSGVSKTSGASTTAVVSSKHRSANDSMQGCPGLGEDTFVARESHGKWTCIIVGGTEVKLDASDLRTLSSITAVPSTAPGNAEADSQPVPTVSRYLSRFNGSLELTAVQEPGDAGTYVTGLSLGSLHNTLQRVALAEAAVFSVVVRPRHAVGTVLAPPAAPRRQYRRPGRGAAAGNRLGDAAGRGPRYRSGHRDRPGGHRLQPHAGSRRERAAAPRGERSPAAPVRRRRQPRAAHPAGRHPRLRRARPAAPRP